VQDPRSGQNPGSGSKLTPGPARCRATVLTAPGKVPHASNRTQLSMTKDPKINNWIHNSPITGFKTHLQSQPAPACRRRGSQSCPLAVPTQDEPVPPGMGGRVRVVCRRCCTQIRMICTVAALAKFETAAIPIARLMPGWRERCPASTGIQIRQQWGQGLPDFDGAQWQAMLTPLLRAIFAPVPPPQREKPDRRAVLERRLRSAEAEARRIRRELGGLDPDTDEGRRQ
jgi:hypothetical protein